MLKVAFHCSICDKAIDGEDLNEHILCHIPPVDVFEIFECLDPAIGDSRFDNRADDIKAIVEQLYPYDNFEAFDELHNTDEWQSEILKAAWDVMAELDDEWNWGEQDFPQKGELRQAISKIVHKYVTIIVNEKLHEAITDVLVQLDWQREQLEEKNEIRET